MLKINRKVEYALMILKHMKESDAGSLFNAKDIGEKYSASFDVVAKVMQQLSGNGILASSQEIGRASCRERV